MLKTKLLVVCTLADCLTQATQTFDLAVQLGQHRTINQSLKLLGSLNLNNSHEVRTLDLP